MTAQLLARPAGPITGSASKPIIYLAGRYSRREEFVGYAQGLIALGLFRCEARWLTGVHEWDGSQDTGEHLAVAQRFALEDLEDLGRAHAVVVFTEPPTAGGRNRGGRHVEYGLALAMQKHVVVVGPAENVFHTLPMVARFGDWAAALAHLIEWKDAVERAVIRRKLAPIDTLDTMVATLRRAAAANELPLPPWRVHQFGRIACGALGVGPDGETELCTMLAFHHSHWHSVEHRPYDGAKVTRWWWR